MAGAIFLSASIPDPKRAPEYAETADIVGITAAVSALVHVVLGRRQLVWGGHPAITPMIWVVAEDLGVEYGNWVKLYQSKFFEDEFPKDNEKFQNVTYVDATAKDRENSLRQMRERMLSDMEFEAGVFIGGMQGVVDEFRMFEAFQRNATRIPVFSTGGAVLDLKDEFVYEGSDLSDEMDYVKLFHDWLNIPVSEKRNS